MFTAEWLESEQVMLPDQESDSSNNGQPESAASAAKDISGYKAMPPLSQNTQTSTNKKLTPSVPPKKWQIAPPPKSSNRLAWILVVVATACVIIFGYIIAREKISTNEPVPPRLAEAFKDQEDSFLIKPPAHWVLQDRYPGTSIVMKGPPEKGFPPLILVCLDIAPDRLKPYLEEYKARLQHEDKSIRFLAEEEDALDGCRTMRLEYDCDYANEQGKVVKVRSLQFILDNRPRFYRITCQVDAGSYDKYKAVFEASARSFQRTAIVTDLPQIAH